MPNYSIEKNCRVIADEIADKIHKEYRYTNKENNFYYLFGNRGYLHNQNPQTIEFIFLNPSKIEEVAVKITSNDEDTSLFVYLVTKRFGMSYK